MNINSSPLVNKDVLNTRKFDNINTENMEDKKLKEVCDSFESFFINQIMDISLKSSSIAGEGTGSDIIKGMYTQALSDKASGSLGISSMLYEFLTKENTK